MYVFRPLTNSLNCKPEYYSEPLGCDFVEKITHGPLQPYTTDEALSY